MPDFTPLPPHPRSQNVWFRGLKVSKFSNFGPFLGPNEPFQVMKEYFFDTLPLIEVLDIWITPTPPHPTTTIPTPHLKKLRQFSTPTAVQGVLSCEKSKRSKMRKWQIASIENFSFDISMLKLTWWKLWKWGALFKCADYMQWGLFWGEIFIFSSHCTNAQAVTALRTKIAV